MTDTADRPLVSFVIVAYNQEPFIRETVEGALAQTYQPLEIILSDDGSPDGTYDIMREMADAYDGPHKVIVNRNVPNLGLIPHIDRVMEIVTGAFVVVNAGDDVSVPERTQKLVDIWQESNREAKLIHSAARQMDEAGRPLDIRRPPERVRDTPTAATFIRDRGFVVGATAAWDRDVFDAFGPLGSGLSAEDRILPFRATLLGRVAYLDEPLVQYRVVGISAHRGQSSAHDYLFGISHRLRKWTAEVDRHVLDRFAAVPYPDKDDIEAVCRRREPLFRFPVELAEAPRLKRLAMAPRACRLALSRSSPEPLKDWLRYTLDWLYIPFSDRRIRRNAPAADTDLVPETYGK